MKKFAIIIIACAFLTENLNAQDKAFEKGNVVIDIGTGLGLYATKSHEERTNSLNIRIAKDTTDGALSAIYPVCFEYGVTNWLGLGARFAYANYLTGNDSTTGNKPKITGIDADLLVNFHFIKTKRLDLPLRVTVGYSSFKYLANDIAGTQAKDNGFNFGVALIPRIYFGNHIGIFFNLGYATYNYPSLKLSNNSDSNLNDDAGQNYLLHLKGSGANIGLGLVVKF
jgi:hypothetical protein